MDRVEDMPELLDGPIDPRHLPANLRDLARVNRWLGGSALSWRALELAVARLPSRPTQLSVLDVGTGAADIPRYLLQRSAGSMLRLAITATDSRPEIVELAGRGSAAIEGLAIDHANGERLPYRERSFDIVHASLVLHHLEAQRAAVALAEMARVARRAIIVNDLDRRRRWWAAAWLLSRLLTTSRYTRHDAPLSVHRAYRPNELSVIAAGAGLREIGRLWTRPAYRYALVFERSDGR